MSCVLSSCYACEGQQVQGQHSCWPAALFAWHLGCQHRDAAHQCGDAFPIFIFWCCCPECAGLFTPTWTVSTAEIEMVYLSPQGQLRSRGPRFVHILHDSSALASCMLSRILTSPCLIPGCDDDCNFQWAEALPVEQARLARPVVPRHLGHCTLCYAHAMGNKRHYNINIYAFDCPDLPAIPFIASWY